MKLAKDFSAIVGLRIRKEYAIPTDSIASIRGHGLLGDKYVSISPGSEEQAIKPGARMTDTESAVDLESLLSRFAFGAMQGDKADKKEPAKAP
jgi:phospholipid/cholesterol/gamma-HCH transport system substrate-binding protein